MGIDRVSDNEYATVRADVLFCALVASKPRSLKGLRAATGRRTIVAGAMPTGCQSVGARRDAVAAMGDGRNPGALN